MVRSLTCVSRSFVPLFLRQAGKVSILRNFHCDHCLTSCRDTDRLWWPPRARNGTATAALTSVAAHAMCPASASIVSYSIWHEVIDYDAVIASAPPRQCILYDAPRKFRIRCITVTRSSIAPKECPASSQLDGDAPERTDCQQAVRAR